MQIKAHTCLYIGLYGRMYLGRMHMCISDCNACRMCGWVGGSFTIESCQSRRRCRQRQHPSSRWTDPRRATCAHSSEFAFQFECQDDGASNLGGGVGGIEMKINHVALRRAGNEPRRCSETQPPLSQREPEAWAHSAPNHSPIWTHLFAFFVAVAKTNVKTFLPSFWVMSIRLIWSAKICDLSDSNSEWAAPRHLPTHEPPCAHRQPHVLCVAQQMLPMWGITWISYVPNSYALTSSHFFIDSRYQSVILLGALCPLTVDISLPNTWLLLTK